MTLQRPTRLRAAETGFTLLEVLLALIIVSAFVIGLQAALGGALDRTLQTKVNRQLTHLMRFQLGQVAVGKLSPDEEDPFPDGQTGGFDDVGGYADEYSDFSWSLARDEVAICGTNEEELNKAGFSSDGSGVRSRPHSDDIRASGASHGAGASGARGSGTKGAGSLGDTSEGEGDEKPEGQFKTRLILTIRWHAPSADQDREASVVLYGPVDDEEEDSPGAGGAGGGAGGNDPSGSKGGAPGNGGAGAGGTGASGRNSDRQDGAK